ncbi:PAS domain-containing protein [Oscillibacter sp.]|uniref:PAS domain-containing protein n=1 Tax=Oscillibacter sp. TaxID=1945593 RepID=UPI002612E528|nr:PAS domain-containing protein [Oscillibacter sp.]MDD3347767.1 PAS domain-containing protein [Oscillibacter sp.]
MAKRWDQFTASFCQSSIPFLVAEVVADGRGEMVDLICRFANDAAAALLNFSSGDMKGQRLTHRFPPRELESFRPVQSVAFSGSSVSFPYTTVLGESLTVTCYQLSYGAVACILDTPHGNYGAAGPSGLPTDRFPDAAAVLELGRSGLRCLSLNRRLCALTEWTQKELLDRFAEDFTLLVAPEDRQSLIQSILDAVRSGQPLALSCRLLRRESPPLWVELRAEVLRTREGVSTLYATFSDIDRERQAQFHLEEALSQLQDAKGQLASLFKLLPGGYCLLRQTADGFVPLQVSPALADLLGDSVEGVQQRLAADPLSLVLPADRESLVAAAAKARAQALPLQHTCRLQTKGGPLWVSLEAAQQTGDDNSRLFYIACSDETRVRELETRLGFRTQLCDLLLERTPVLLLDYDPLADVARVESCRASSRRTLRVVERYIASMEDAAFIHPEDRRRLAAAVKRAVTQPTAEHPEYRGDYDGDGWRWYRVSWLRQIDTQGNVTRLLGKAEDVTAAKAAAQRFAQLKSGQKRLTPGVLALATLDLTEDRILDAKAAGRHLSHVLFGNTADACLRHLRENLSEPSARQAFDALLSRDALLAAFGQGQTALSMEHRLFLDKTRAVWAKLDFALAEHPDTGRLVAFCTVRSTEDAHLSDAVLGALAEEFDAVLTVDTATGSCRLFSPQLSAPAPLTYRALTAIWLRSQPPSPQRAALRRAVRLQTVLSALGEQPRYQLAYEAPAPGGAQQAALCFRFLDRESGTLLVTGRRILP